MESVKQSGTTSASAGNHLALSASSEIITRRYLTGCQVAVKPPNGYFEVYQRFCFLIVDYSCVDHRCAATPYSGDTPADSMLLCVKCIIDSVKTSFTNTFLH
jgi:hypothetical protein